MTKFKAKIDVHRLLLWILVASCIRALVGTDRLFAQNPPKPSSPNLDEAASKARSSLNLSIHGNFDCSYNFNADKGTTQDCLNVSSLSLLGERQVDRIYGSLSINPFGTPVGAYEDRPRQANLPTNADQSMGLIEDYRLIWSPRPHLEVGVESFRGSAVYPSPSPLALSNPFMETGWKQTALTVTYNLLALPEMRVKFAAGNGEGENGKNLDTQQYFGFDMSALLFKALRGHLGMSLDGNSTGSEEIPWKNRTFSSECDSTIVAGQVDAAAPGYSTQRLSLGFVVDGIWPGSEGMQIGVGYQRNILSDLNKHQQSQFSVDDLKKCPRLNFDSLFVEDLANNTVNTVQRTVYNFDLVYNNRSSYFLALNYSKRDLDSGSIKLFSPCISSENGRCTETSGAPVNNFQTDALTAGIGLFLAKSTTLSVEYQLLNFDKLYDLANFPDRDGSISKTKDILNARFSVSLR